MTTHPIQYYAPWFRWIAANSEIELKVFYLWNRGAEAKHDPGFGRAVQWDVPLLDGYEHEFIPNTARIPGSDRFWGIRNEKVGTTIQAFRPDAALLMGYRYASMMRLIFTPERVRGYPLMFRGDSHRLDASRSATWKVESGKENGEFRNSEVRSRNLLQSAIRSPKSALRRATIAGVFRRFSAFLYVGQANGDYFRIHGVPEEKLFFAPHAIDNERFIGSADAAGGAAKDWRRSLGIPEDHLVVLFAAKFEEKKRPLDLLTAFRSLQRDDVSLLFVGNGQLEQELRSRAAGLRNVLFAPFQNQSEMPRTYAACDLFILPSFGAEESWGLAVNEALCLARPVIVSDHVGCAADLVRHDQTGLVFPAGDLPALTEALRKALSDREQLREWGTAGREIVRNYDYAHATAGLLEALQTLKAEGKSESRKWPA